MHCNEKLLRRVTEVDFLFSKFVVLRELIGTSPPRPPSKALPLFPTMALTRTPGPMRGSSRYHVPIPRKFLDL